MIEKPAEVVELFNSHFCSVGAEFDSKIPRSSRSPLSYILCWSSIGYWGWMNYWGLYYSFPRSVLLLYQEICKKLSVVVSKLLNASIAEGHFPEILKVEWVISIFKSGLREIINNHRSILTLGVLSIIFREPYV